jgi:hypothetical protein
MDIHDISRSARTFGAKGYFLVTPIEVQHELVERILSHWRSEQSRKYHPDRFEALKRAKVVRTFEDVKSAIIADCGERPEVVLTDAREIAGPKSTSYADYRRELSDPARKKPVCIVFGTGWGISDTFYPEVDRILAPIYGREGKGPDDYNHLSVRSAVAIILDRLFGN